MVRESRLVAAREQPPIITIHDVGEEDGQVYRVTELIDGETLRARPQRGALPASGRAAAATAIAARAAAHARGVVHRDSNPKT
jgi:serine/threonine-protein kinase